MWTVKNQYGLLQTFTDEVTAFSFAVSVAHLHPDLTFTIYKDGELRHEFKSKVRDINTSKYAQTILNQMNTAPHRNVLASHLLKGLHDPRPEEIH